MWCIGRALMIAIGVHTRYYFRGPHNIYNLPLIAFWIAFFSAFVSFFIPFIHRRLLLHIINFNLVRCAFDFISYNIDTLNYTINMYRMQCRRIFFLFVVLFFFVYITKCITRRAKKRLRSVWNPFSISYSNECENDFARIFQNCQRYFTEPSLSQHSESFKLFILQKYSQKRPIQSALITGKYENFEN